MRSAQSSGRPTSKRGVSASPLGSKLQTPVNSPSVVIDSEMTARPIDRLHSPSNLIMDNRAVDQRSMRRIIANDPEWTLATVPDLVELTIRHIVSNFAS